MAYYGKYAGTVESPGTVAFRKEMVIRKKMAKIFNRREEDFSTLREYNDYLEEVEDMAYNWVAGVDVEAIKAKVEQYELENAELIAMNEARKAEERINALKGPVADTTADPQQQEEVQGAGYKQKQPTIPYVSMREPKPVPGYTKPPPPTDEEGIARQIRAGGCDPSIFHRRAHQQFLDTLFI